MDNVYCVKDRWVTQNVKGTARIVSRKNNRKMLKVKCAVCGITKTQFLKQNWHSQLYANSSHVLHRHEEYLIFPLWLFLAAGYFF